MSITRNLQVDYCKQVSCSFIILQGKINDHKITILIVEQRVSTKDINRFARRLQRRR